MEEEHISKKNKAISMMVSGIWALNQEKDSKKLKIQLMLACLAKI